MDFMSKPFEEYVRIGNVKNGSVVEFPSPFNDLDRFPDKIKADGVRNKIALRPAMTKAFLILTGFLKVHKAIVCLGDGKSTVEYSEKEGLDVLFQYNPVQGGHTFFGAVRDDFTGIVPYRLKSNTPQDATAFWLGVIPMILEKHPDKSILEERMKNLEGFLALQQYDPAWEMMALCQYFVYEVITGANDKDTMPATWANKQDACAQIDLTNFSAGEDVKIYCGAPEWINGSDPTSKKVVDVFTPNDPKETEKLHKFMQREVRDYAPWEKAMIPELNERYEETQIDVDIIETISRTWSKPQDMQVKNFAFFGPAGSGKSAAEEHLASLLKMPFSKQMCSSGDDETSLFGTIIPVVEGMKTGLSGEAKAIAEIIEASGERINLEAVAEAIGFPSPEVCMFDKEAALEMMGLEDSGEPIMDQRRKELEKRILKVTEKNSGKDSVTYKYIPSPLVTGIENGHMVALEEPTNVFNQGIFSCLYDVLDRNSKGTIRTPIGVVTRHPDFVCLLSSNTSYTGNRDLPGPLKSRFQFLAHFKEPDEESLAKRVMTKLGVAQEHFSRILQCVKAYKAGNQRARDIGQSADYEATPRALFCFTDAVLDGENPRKAYAQYVLPHLANEKEDIDAIWDAVRESEIFWRN